jgi:hypothetical protein
VENVGTNHYVTTNITNTTVNHTTGETYESTPPDYDPTINNQTPGETVNNITVNVPETQPATFGGYPEIQDWYEPKYKEGFSGMWRNNMDRLNTSPLMQTLSAIGASVPSGGSCPEWIIETPLGAGNVAPPCYVWPALGAIMLVLAAVLATKLIFGGA